MKKTNTNLFETYLREVHARECPVTDDEFPEHLKRWILTFKKEALVDMANEALAAMQEKHEKEIRYRNEQED